MPIPWRRRAKGRDPVVERRSDLFDPNKIDLMTRRPGDGALVLYIIQDQPWLNTVEEFDSLRAKVDNHVRDVANSHLAAGHGDAADHNWRIMIDSYVGPPSEPMLNQLRVIGSAVAGEGGQLLLHEAQPPTAPGGLPRTVRVRRLLSSGDEPADL